MDLQLLSLAYTILAALIAVAFWLGNEHGRLSSLANNQSTIEKQLAEIFVELRELNRLAAQNQAWHRQTPD